ncbi:MAG: right-handed parallel beta-helix repeat-containing protein [Candidatus Thermoplasmatota archaeon]|nr:right-handed parallel beta-helix repeat-containing protein [Candidatus Thermoplasmatota archaeon]MBU1941573.1 right-handed parallel beta-helix repeat-containing protein [Candidatus Thermoplasmatota archaeon]
MKIPYWQIIFLATMIIILLPAFSTASLIVQTHTNTYQTTHYVGGYGPGNYSTIQSAINNASPGDAIYVYDNQAPYQENLFIDKPLTLYGQNKYTTIIDGTNNNNTITITANNVTITQFTICNGSGGHRILNWYQAGIRIIANNTKIHQNIIKDNRLGIFIKESRQLIIRDNIFLNDCIVLSPYDKDMGYTPFEASYYHHIIENNTVNGKPLYYQFNLHNTIIPNTVGQILLVSSTNTTIQHCDFQEADFAIILINARDCTIHHNTLTNGTAGMLWMLYSSNNQLYNNTLTQNLEGICLDCSSTDNTLSHNTLVNNSICNIMIESRSHRNTINHNSFRGTPRAHSYLSNSFQNKYYQNYWEDHHTTLPKVITGELLLPLLQGYRLPWYAIDWFPKTSLK